MRHKEGMKKWLVDAGIKDLQLIEKYVQGLMSQGYTEASLMHYISPGTLEKAGVVLGLHSDMILNAAKAPPLPGLGSVPIDKTRYVMNELLSAVEFPKRYDINRLQEIIDEPLRLKIVSTNPPRDEQEAKCIVQSKAEWCPELESTFRLAIAGTSLPGMGATEMDWSGFWYSFFFGGFLRMAIRMGLLNVMALRNAEASSSATVGCGRDFNLIGDTVLLVAGEENLHQEAKNKAINELVDKAAASVTLYGNLRYFLGFTATASVFSLFAITFPDYVDDDQKVKVEDLQRQYDVSNDSERVQLYIALINVCRWVRSVLNSKVLLVNALPPFQVIKRRSPYNRHETTTMINKVKYIEKRILLPEDKISTFEQVYVALRDINAPTHIKLTELRVSSGNGKGESRLQFLGQNFVKPDFQKKGGSIWITMHLTPIGARVMPEGDEEVCECFVDILSFLAAFHEKGFVHRDLRWPNILRYQTKNWFVIDFELAGPIDVAPWWTNEKLYLSTTRPCTAQTDLYQVGILLETTGKFTLVSSKLKHKTYPNAKEALAELKSFANPQWVRFPSTSP